MHLVDRLAHGNRWADRHPAEKLALGGGLLIAAVALPAIPAAVLVLAAAALAAVAGARVPPADYLRVLAIPAGFELSGAVVLAVSVRLDGAGPAIALSPQGIETAIAVSLRALAATAASLLIVLTTPLTDLLGLLRRCRLPAAIVDVGLLVYRFTATTLEMAERARVAQASRLGYTGPRRSLQSIGLLAAALLPRCLGRAARMERGLAARAYDGDLRTLQPSRPASGRFLAAAVAVPGLIAATAAVWPVIAGAGR
ncbi:MAG: cobalt ECF transporter T component CbiQ [Rhodospirillales bacterium]